MQYVLFLFCVLLTSFSTLARAERVEGVRLAYTATESCRNVSVLYYSHSTHPGGNQYGFLNENNGGIGFRCYHSKGSPFYFTLSALNNSQFGGTLVAGPGLTFTLLRIGRVSLNLGGEMPFVYYESPRHKKIVYGFLPVGTVGLNLALPDNSGTIGYVQNHLADTGVKLYVIQYSRSF